MVGVILFVFLPLLGGFLWIFDLLTLSDSAVDQESHHRLWTSHILVPWAAWESPSFAGFLLGFIDGKRGFLCINKTLVEVGIMKFTLFVNLVLWELAWMFSEHLWGKVFVYDSKVALAKKWIDFSLQNVWFALWCFWIVDLFIMIFYVGHLVNHHQTTIWKSSFSFSKHLFCKFKESLCFGVSKWNGWMASSSRHRKESAVEHHKTIPKRPKTLDWWRLIQESC